MIVFYLLLIIVCLALMLLFSSIEIDVKNVEIDNICELNEISSLIFSDEYYKIFNYIKINIKIKIQLFSILPILIFKIDNKKIKRIIKKQTEVKKHLMDIERLKIYFGKKNNQKQIIQLFKKTLVRLKMKRTELYLNIGLDNAKATAIVSGAINAMISVFLLKALDSNLGVIKSKKRIAKIKNNFSKIIYKVEPVYIEKLAFSFRFSTKFKIPTIVFLL